MTNYSQKWTIVTFLQPLDGGYRYAMQDWPMHVTLADVFAADFEDTNLLQKIHDLAAHTKSFRATPLKNSRLGSSGSPIDVTLLQKTDELVLLHNSLVILLEENGATFNTPAYTKEGFLPHVTIRGKRFLGPQEQIKIDSISLIDMFPDGNWQQRKVVATYKLQ